MESNALNIILLNFNGSSDTIQCLNSIFLSDFDKIEITIIDNNSKSEDYLNLRNYIYTTFNNCYEFYSDKNNIVLNDKKNKKVKTKNFKVNLIKSSINLGFANGNNLGIEFGRKRKFNYFFILNNDTEILKNTISILMNFLIKNRQYSVLTPQIRYFNQKNIIWNCGGFIKFYGKCKYLHQSQDVNKIILKKKYDVTFITGCAMLIDLKKTGLFSNQYFFGEEDYDFSLRQMKNNIKMGCITDSIIFHKVNKTIDKTANNISRIYYYYLCRIINLSNHYHYIHFYLLYFLIIIKLFWNSIFNLNISILKAIKNISYLINTYKNISKNNLLIDENIFKKYLIIKKWN